VKEEILLIVNKNISNGCRKALKVCTKTGWAHGMNKWKTQTLSQHGNNFLDT
jgi:hypothetical protein